MDWEKSIQFEMMDIKNKFLELTSHTYPHGKEHLLFDKLPQDLEMDELTISTKRSVIVMLCLLVILTLPQVPLPLLIM